MGTFKEASHAFDPATLTVLQSAFDAAWADLLAAGSAHAKGDHAKAIRELLASRIIRSANAGVRDPRQLKTAALDGLL